MQAPKMQAFGITNRGAAGAGDDVHPAYGNGGGER